VPAFFIGLMTIVLVCVAYRGKDNKMLLFSTIASLLTSFLIILGVVLYALQLNAYFSFILFIACSYTFIAAMFLLVAGQYGEAPPPKPADTTAPTTH